jgi:TRAP-type transport system small permease protein
MNSVNDQGESLPIARLAVEQWIGVVAMAAVVLITLTNVGVRYFTNQSFAWTEEISVFLLVVLTLAGSAWAATKDAHIRIDFVYVRGSATRQRVLRTLSRIGTSGMFLLIAVLSARAAIGEYELGETTSGLGVPRWWYTLWLPLMALWAAIRTWWSRGGVGTDDPSKRQAQ